METLTWRYSNKAADFAKDRHSIDEFRATKKIGQGNGWLCRVVDRYDFFCFRMFYLNGIYAVTWDENMDIYD